MILFRNAAGRSIKYKPGLGNTSERPVSMRKLRDGSHP